MVAKPPARVIILMDPKLIAQIEDFRFEQRIPTRAEAIRKLIEIGLRHAPKPPRTPS
jgi:metal-responsive CopG/Arc/MetJ family transcriptional regulator